MIEVRHIQNIREEKDFYLFTEDNSEALTALDDLSAVHLVVKGENLEFKKLLEVSLSYLMAESEIHAAYVELSPKKKSKLRSHKGMYYGLRKVIPEGSFVYHEFDLPDNNSLFLGLMCLNQDTLPVFIEHMLLSSFSFGFIFYKKTPLSDFDRTALLKMLFEETVDMGKHLEIDYLKGIATFTSLHAIVFRLTTDGQDNQYLEFYGRREILQPKMDRLVARLSENFYLRRRLPVKDEMGNGKWKAD